MTETPLERLQSAIQAELERDPKGPRVAGLLRDYAAAQQCWRPFALFDPATYARNLVHKSDEYEMMVVCWQASQESPIHNHAGQHCWMAVLEGEIEEIHYTMPSEGQSTPLVETRTSVFSCGDVAYINDDIALHKVRPVEGQAGVTLHLYSKPIQICNVYDPETCTVGQRELAFHSIAGAVT